MITLEQISARKRSEFEGLKKHSELTYWSRSSALNAAHKVETKYPHFICHVDYPLYADGTRDWTVNIYEKPTVPA